MRILWKILKIMVLTMVVISISAWITFFNISPFHELGADYYGCFRYMLSGKFLDTDTGAVIEPNVYESYYQFPYIYLYGESGYTKVRYINAAGIPGPYIVKVPDYAFYSKVLTKWGRNDYRSVSYLQKQYETQLRLIKWDRLHADDKEIFQRLKQMADSKKKPRSLLTPRIPVSFGNKLVVDFYPDEYEDKTYVEKTMREIQQQPWYPGLFF